MNEALEELRLAVAEAADRQDVLDAVGRVYGELSARIEQRRPVCVASGKCCHFERYGHRLYVSTMELAAFVSAARDHGVPASEAWDGSGCPLQIGKLCGVHRIRPFGCRVFFCDPSAQQWQQDLYESMHGQMRKLHDALAVPYFYTEWRAALRAVGLVTPVE